MNSEIKTCQNCKKEFTIEPEDFKFYEKISVPPPTFCSLCRFQRRLAYRNERKLFWNKSVKSGKEILALYSRRSGVTLYDEDEWRQDDWDAMKFGRDFDNSKTFFEQMHELALIIPRTPRSTESNIRSDFTANIGWSKDCYLVFNCSEAENCAYGNQVDFSKDCFDVSHVTKCERCYESFWQTSCYRTNFSIECEGCVNVWFSKNCIGCTNCFGCVNLRNQNYCFFNENLSKEEYEKRIGELNLDKWSRLSEMKRKVRDFRLRFPVKYMNGIKNSNVLGEYISNSKNIYRGYIIRGGEDLRYCQCLNEPTSKDSMDVCIWGKDIDLCYETSVSGWGISRLKFCVECWPGDVELEYCMFMKNCSNCFGCFGLKNKQYCILNKQYTRTEYAELREKIIKHMNTKPYIDAQGLTYKYGEFFPVEHSPFGYNSSIVNEYFPLSKESTIEIGYAWDDPESKLYETDTDTSELPDSIFDVSDDILAKIIACEKCKKAYRIIKSELDFLRHEGIPLPRLCIDCRHFDRISQRNGPILFERKCMCEINNHDWHENRKCHSEFETSYTPERPEIIYCEQCYNQEVA